MPFITPVHNNFSSGYATGAPAGTIQSQGPTVAVLNGVVAGGGVGSANLFFENKVFATGGINPLIQKGQICTVFPGSGLLALVGVAAQECLAVTNYIAINLSVPVMVVSLRVFGIVTLAADGDLAYGTPVYMQVADGTVSGNPDASAVPIGILLAPVVSHATHALGDLVPVLLLPIPA